MAREFKRTDRIADQMQRDLAELVRSEVKDPRVGMVTINQVSVAKDLGYADVYVTLLTMEDLDEHAEQVKTTIKVLNGAAGFLRSELGKRIKLRTIPQLRFHFDACVNASFNVSILSMSWSGNLEIFAFGIIGSCFLVILNSFILLLIFYCKVSKLYLPKLIF